MPELSQRAERLNLGCACQFLDRKRLCAELSRDPALAELCPELSNSHPHLFSASSVFISPSQLRAMQDVITAVELVTQLPAWQAAVAGQQSLLAGAHTRGGLLGFDFHLDNDKVQLIEINTNPGGALLNVALARVQRACCAEMETLLSSPDAWPYAEAAILEVFRAEWRQAGRQGEPACIAIVDDNPVGQYLYPEFLLYRHLFEQAGWQAVIADPAELVWRDGSSWHEGVRIDFVYNRLTDFRLVEPSHRPLREAWLTGAIVLSPHPHAHARYANKRNLTLLSDPAFLENLPLPEEARHALLLGVPHTELVTPAHDEAMWAARKGLFFKPHEGFGSRAAYRGDKLTRRVWEDIRRGDYVAQRLAPPSERQVDAKTRLKLDIRAFAYGGDILLLAARLYNGQTTNFRTPGGGFAPVWVMPSA